MALPNGVTYRHCCMLKISGRARVTIRIGHKYCSLPTNIFLCGIILLVSYPRHVLYENIIFMGNTRGSGEVPVLVQEQLAY